MTIYYKIPNKYPYIDFAKQILFTDITQMNAKQFIIDSTNYLIISDSPITGIAYTIPLNSIEITSIQQTSNHSLEKAKSHVCFSIRISDIEKSDVPYEYISSRISQIYYNVNNAILHTDPYGIEYIIVY